MPFGVLSEARPCFIACFRWEGRRRRCVREGETQHHIPQNLLAHSGAEAEAARYDFVWGQRRHESETWQHAFQRALGNSINRSMTSRRRISTTMSSITKRNVMEYYVDEKKIGQSIPKRTRVKKMPEEGWCIRLSNRTISILHDTPCQSGIRAMHSIWLEFRLTNWQMCVLSTAYTSTSRWKKVFKATNTTFSFEITIYMLSLRDKMYNSGWSDNVMQRPLQSSCKTPSSNCG